MPARRGLDEATGEPDADVQRGREAFHASGCAACHTPSHVTGAASADVLALVAEQTIWPYTDLLLHDLGGSCEPVRREVEEGAACTGGAACAVWRLDCSGLADGRPDVLASASEWRTAPLWGIGLVRTVNPDARFLHDGRARTIEEAVLWHGGEAAGARDRFTALARRDRSALLRFLESL